MPAPGPAAEFLHVWHAALAGQDAAAVAPLFADDCEMISPVLWKMPVAPGYAPYVVATFYAIVSDFRYRREWVDETGKEIILEFEATIGGRGLVGIDRISLDDAGRAVRFEVMIRPLNALTLVAEAMRERFSAGAA